MTATEVDKLVTENIGLVNMVVRRYLGHGTEYEDLFQIGAVGLVKAAKNYDVSKNLKFSTYAVSKIVGELKTYFRDNGSVKIARSRKEQLFKIKRAKTELTGLLGRMPTISEIADKTEIPKEDIIECLEINENVLSLDKESEEGGSLYGALGEDTQDRDLMHIMLREAVDKLAPTERQIIVMRYFLDKTQAFVAEKLGITQVQVSRMEKNILKKLSKMIS